MKKTLIILLISSFSFSLYSQAGFSNEGVPVQSGGSLGPDYTSESVPLGPGIIPLNLTSSYLAMNFDDNVTETGGWMFIPPDPMGAAGTDRIIAVTNVMIEARDKSGVFQWRDALQDFFTTLTPANFLFDPKIVWDHYEDRFLVVALEATHAGVNPNSGNTSRILLAVSKTATPGTATTADWYYFAIISEESRGGVDYWADYPGFEVCEEAVYVTNNMFAHSPAASAAFTSRLWIIDKRGGSDWYATGAIPIVTTWEPYTEIGWTNYETTTMPALVFGAGGASPAGTGTYLVSYSGLSLGGPGAAEAVIVIRVNDPIGSPTFTNIGNGITIGDIEDVGGIFGWPALPDAPQSGTGTLIEVNDRRVLDAVWQDDPNHSPMLWFTTTINPNAAFDATNAGETTATWVRINTTTATLDDKGTIGGEDIAAGAYTFFPALAVDPSGNAYFGFSASASSIYPGAYAAGQHFTDPAGTVRASETVMAGLDFYQRTFGTYPADRNRWGDYSGAAIDPDDGRFWVFNEYAMARALAGAPEDGRWGTAWGVGEFQVPVILGSYTAEVTNTGVKLNWTTESEVENLGFIIERKIEGEDWTEIVSYKTDGTLSGQGTTSSYMDYEYVDRLVEFGNTYKYRLVDVDYNGIVNYNAVRTVTIDKPQLRNEGGIPLILLNPYPNPFNPITTLYYSISENRDIVVEIYDITGQLVKTLVDKEQSAGWHNVQWNGTNRSGKLVPAGLYIGKVSTGNDIKTTKLMLLK